MRITDVNFSEAFSGPLEISGELSELSAALSELDTTFFDHGLLVQCYGLRLHELSNIFDRLIDCSDQRNVQLMVSRGGTKKLVDVDSRNIIPIMQSQDDLHNVCGEC